MATDPQIEGFDPDEVRAGLRLAMAVGLPPVPADQPTFFMPTSVTGDGSHTLDGQGTPFDPAYRPTRTVPQGIQVPCSIEYRDRAGDTLAAPERVVLGLLDEDYAKVKGFASVVIGGVSYRYQRTDPPKGLVSVGIYLVHCLSDDQG